jgi:hypothetical protein
MDPVKAKPLGQSKPVILMGCMSELVPAACSFGCVRLGIITYTFIRTQPEHQTEDKTNEVKGLVGGGVGSISRAPLTSFVLTSVRCSAWQRGGGGQRRAVARD